RRARGPGEAREVPVLIGQCFFTRRHRYAEAPHHHTRFPEIIHHRLECGSAGALSGSPYCCVILADRRARWECSEVHRTSVWALLLSLAARRAPTFTGRIVEAAQFGSVWP